MSDSRVSHRSIFFICNSASFFVSHRFQIALAARSIGYDCYICAPADMDTSIFTANGLNFISTPVNRRPSLSFSDIMYFFRLFFLVFKYKPSIVHLITIRPVIFGGLVLRFFPSIALVIAISGLGSVFVDDSLLGKFRRSMVSFFYSVVTKKKRLKVIVQNTSDCDVLLNNSSLSPSRIILIPGSGVDLALFHPRKRHTPVKIKVLFAARLLKEKGLLDFIDCARFFAVDDNVEFFVAGPFDQYNPSAVSEELIFDAHDKGIITYLGTVNDMPNLLADSDIFCYPSWYGEGVPKVLIEAAACGLPIITTDHPGCRDVIVNGQSGFLVPVKSVDELTKAVSLLVSDSELRLDFSNFAREIAVKNFDVNSVVSTHLALYSDLTTFSPCD